MRAPALVAALLALPALAGAMATPPLPATLRDTGYDGPCKVAFTPRYPLWTDGAAKRRWICLPPGAAIDRRDPDAWDFPPGTKLWKEFAYDRPVETRYIERLPDGSWRYAAYAWNAEGTEATLVPDAGSRVGSHAIPSRLDCLACHEGPAVPVLGYSAVQLAPDPIRGATQRESAALGYLHGNCGHCHNDTAAVAGVDLVLQQKASRPDESRRATIASLLSGTRRMRAPQRMASTDPNARMPPLGVAVPDVHGIALVRGWMLDLDHPQEK